MDIGNVALTITHLIVLLSICNMSYQLIKIKSSVSRKGYNRNSYDSMRNFILMGNIIPTICCLYLEQSV